MIKKLKMKVLIKNMVCLRCEIAVQTIIEKMGLTLIHISLGEVVIQEKLNHNQLSKLNTVLKDYGIELLDDKSSITIEKIKAAIIDLVHNKHNDINTNLSNYISLLLLQDYHSLSKLFSQKQGITIEKYFIYQKIEKVKEWLVYDELTLKEIALELNYSSTAYLSNQFKSITGLTPTDFKKLKIKVRKKLDDV